MVVHKCGIAYYDNRRAALFENLSFDAGNDYACLAGNPLSCDYVYGGLDSFFYVAKYFACGGRRDVDDGDGDYFYVGFPNRNGILFQLCISFRTDRDMDCHDY